MKSNAITFYKLSPWLIQYSILYQPYTFYTNHNVISTKRQTRQKYNRKDQRSFSYITADYGEQVKNYDKAVEEFPLRSS